MLTHILWFLALMLSIWAVRQEVRNQEQAKHALSMQTMRGEFTTLIGKEREIAHAATVAQKAVTEARDHWMKEARAWEKRYDAERDRVNDLLTPRLYQLDGSDEQPLSVAEADRMAAEEDAARERASLVPVRLAGSADDEDDEEAEPPFRVEDDGDDED